MLNAKIYTKKTGISKELTFEKYVYILISAVLFEEKPGEKKEEKRNKPRRTKKNI